MNQNGQSRWMRFLSRSTVLLLCVSIVLGVVAPVSAQDRDVEREYSVKAAFLYNFLRFTKWPSSDVKAKRGKPIIIGVLGDSPFNSSVFKSVDNKVVPLKNRKLVVKYLGAFRPGVDLKQCTILFVSASEKDQFNNIVKAVANLHIMTVADTSGFLDQGGMINLVIKNRNVRWEINDAAVKKSSLKLNSQLYRSAVKVVGK